MNMENMPLTIFTLIMAIFFFIFATIFALLKEKACLLISGYNFKSKKERLKYDEKRLSLDMRNNFITYGIIFVIGSIPTYFFGMWCFILTLIIWLIYFFKNVHLDDKKAFEKYKK